VRRYRVLLSALMIAACAEQELAPPAPFFLKPGADPDTPAVVGGLVGRDTAALRVTFGAPHFVRREAGSEFWRYDGDRCALFFFLYPGDGGRDDSDLRVRHVETLPQGANSAADARCVASVRSRAVSAPVS